jgi:uncharacterized integral membrane protein
VGIPFIGLAEGGYMWVIRYFLLLVLIVVILGFAIYNSAQRIDINLPGRQFFDVPIMIVILCAFCVGLLVSFILTMAHSFKMSALVRNGKRRVDQLEMELAALRNRSLEDVERLEESEVKPE